MASIAGSKGGTTKVVRRQLKALRKPKIAEKERGKAVAEVQKSKQEVDEKKWLFSPIGNVAVPGSEKEFKMSENFYYGNSIVKITSLGNALDHNSTRQECVLEYPGPFKERAFQCRSLKRSADSAKICNNIREEFPCLNNGVGVKAETRFKEIIVSPYDVYQIAKMQGQGQDGILANKGGIKNLFFCVVFHNCPSDWSWTLGMLTVEWYHDGWCFSADSLYPLRYNSESYSYGLASRTAYPTGTRVFTPIVK